MTREQLETARAQVEPYGYDVRKDGVILTPCGKQTLVRIAWHRSRFVAFGSNNGTPATRVYTGKDLGEFVGRFWLAKKVAS